MVCMYNTASHIALMCVDMYVDVYVDVYVHAHAC